MALVDAATSILEDNAKASSSCIKSSSELVTDVRSSSSHDDTNNNNDTSRPSTPAIIKDCPPHAVSPTSVSSGGTTTVEESLSEKKLSFAEQLMVILDSDEYSDVLTWMPDGKAFTIVEPKRFTKELMPRFFNIRNMSSFVRKLTRWGFARVHEKETMNSDIFKHPDFQRGKSRMCRDIKCVGRATSISSSTAANNKNTSPTGLNAIKTSSAATTTTTCSSSTSTSLSLSSSQRSIVIQVPSQAACHTSLSTVPPVSNKYDKNITPTKTLPYSNLPRSNDPLLEALALRHYLEHQTVMSNHPNSNGQNNHCHSLSPHSTVWMCARPENYFTPHNRRALHGWTGHGNPHTLPY